jgi:hypothetical protein
LDCFKPKPRFFSIDAVASLLPSSLFQVNEPNRELAIERATVVTKRRLLHDWKLASAAVVAFCLVVGTSAAGNRKHEECDVWFVHATDPHLFLKAVDEKKDAEAAEKKKRQEEVNRKALTDMLKRIRSLPGGEGPSAFLVLTGDLGIDPCEIPKGGDQSVITATAEEGTPPQGEAQNGDRQTAKDKRSAHDCVTAFDRKKRKEQIEKIAELLGESPVPNIYLVAGNNDIAKESAGNEALKYFNDFIDDVQKELIKNKSSVVLHNLTRCYAIGGEPAGCYADINTAYRLIGFPSYSFKSAKDEAGLDHNQEQVRQFETFRQLLERSQQAGRKVLVVTHTPEMDDPYLLAQERYVNPTANPTVTPTPGESASPAKKESENRQTGNQSESAAKNAQSSSAATWKVSDDVLKGWKDAIASDSVMGVFAGHLHDSHEQIYQRPYTWSSGSLTALRKLFLAPPLAVKNQDNSPIQARGFSLIHLQPDHIASRLYWYNSQTGEFTPDREHKPRCEQHRFLWGGCQGLRAAIRWLWGLDNDTPLVRLAVLLIAFLTAFLTIVAIWQIPAPSAEDKKATDETSKTTQGTSSASAESSPFANRFGKTVIAGLGGLVAAEVAKTLGNQQASADTRWYYIVWFIVSFFFLLVFLNLWRAVVEALRSRVAVVYYPLARDCPLARAGRKDEQSRIVLNGVGYWLVKRPLRWLASLRVPLLTFSDTFINLIQGKNQTRTEVFEKTIIEQQRNLVLVAGAIRESLNHLIEGRLRAPQESDWLASPPLLFATDQLDSVRVNISVLSRDQTNVFYISWAHGSSRQAFPQHSVAWASVFTGQPLWYLSNYREDFTFEKIVLFQESPIPGEKGPILLNDYYQGRQHEDYKAFIILPLPLPRRDPNSDYVKGAIHISFRHPWDLSRFWNTEFMKPRGDPPIYPTPPSPYLEEWYDDPEVRAALTNSIAALGELLRGFNEIIYKNYIAPEQTG